MDRSDAPQVLRDFLVYHETIRGHSKNTVDEYYLDLRTFFRYLKLSRGLVPRTTELENISISDIDVPFISRVTLAEIYDFLAFLSRDRVKQPNSPEPEFGLTASSRARKIAAIRSFFKYMTVKAKLAGSGLPQASKNASALFDARRKPAPAFSRRRFQQRA